MNEIAITVRDVMELVVQVLSILKGFHRKDVIHNDCKLENILMEFGNYINIGRFKIGREIFFDSWIACQ